jgi:hypothetical protein
VARGRGIRRLRALALITGLLVAGCGSNAQTFTASEFIDRINVGGVSIELGRQLPSGGDAKELYAVKLPPLPGEPTPPPGSEGGPGASGSLYVFGDTGGADDQLDACRGSGGLLCFQASNHQIATTSGRPHKSLRALPFAPKWSGLVAARRWPEREGRARSR